jgi:hypothetical protein
LVWAAGRALLFPSGLLLVFAQHALGPGFGLALVQVGVGMLLVPELPEHLTLDAESGAQDDV